MPTVAENSAAIRNLRDELQNTRRLSPTQSGIRKFIVCHLRSSVVGCLHRLVLIKTSLSIFRYTFFYLTKVAYFWQLLSLNYLSFNYYFCFLVPLMAGGRISPSEMLNQYGLERSLSATSYSSPRSVTTTSQLKPSSLSPDRVIHSNERSVTFFKTILK